MPGSEATAYEIKRSYEKSGSRERTTISERDCSICPACAVSSIRFSFRACASIALPRRETFASVPVGCLSGELLNPQRPHRLGYRTRREYYRYPTLVLATR